MFEYYDYGTDFPSADKYILRGDDESKNKIDSEMAQGKNKKAIVLNGFKQDTFEYFVERYGKGYECIVFDIGSNLINDFSPSEDLEDLIRVDIKWNIRAKELWNMERNRSLKRLVIKGWKKGTFNPEKLRTSGSLEYVEFWGSDCFSRYPMQSLDVFRGMDSLKGIHLEQIKPVDRSTDFLSGLPNLEEFHFDASMFTTEEIAYMCAKYPHIYGRFLRAYNDNEIGCDVRISGSRKPELFFPEDLHKLDKYVNAFNALVEKYKNEDQGENYVKHR